MPTHSVDEAFDPSFLDEITVIRRVQNVSQMGRVTETTQSTTQVAVVVPTSPNNLDRLPDATRMNKSIQVYTPFRLQSAVKDSLGNQMLPDLILWHGSTFIVNALDDFSGYGRGWVMAIATATGGIPAPPIPDPIGSA